MFRRASVFLSLWLAWALGSCVKTEPATQIVVVVRSDLELDVALDTLEVRIVARDQYGDDAPPMRSYSLAKSPQEGQHRLPLSFSVAPGARGFDQDFRVIVTGFLGGEAVVEQQAITAFVERQSRVLDLFLAARCQGVLCRDGQDRRTALACESVSTNCEEVQPNHQLPPWQGPGSELSGDASISPEPETSSMEPDASSTRHDASAGDAGASESPPAIVCDPGFRLSDGDCADVDECSKDPNPCGAAACRNRTGGYSCGDCPTGYAPNAAGACTDIDECVIGSHNCDVNADCENSPGAFACVCARRRGFAGPGTWCGDFDECTELDVNGCDTDPPSCSNLAPNAGRFACVCPSGFAGSGKGVQGCSPLLDALNVSWGNLSPPFAPEVNVYTVDAGSWHEHVGLSVRARTGHHVQVDGVDVANDQVLERVLALGSTTTTITVAVGGAVRTYSITFSRTAPSQRLLKADNGRVDDSYGTAVALNRDGRVLAVGAQNEASSSQGVNSAPNQAALAAGAAYILRRDGDSWRQEAYLKASNTRPQNYFGCAIALSADGDTVAVGARGEYSSSTGINSVPVYMGEMDAGAVYVFRRVQGIWSQEAYIKAPEVDSSDDFGEYIALSDDGSTLAVGAPGDDSLDNLKQNAGAVFVYKRSGPAWQLAAQLKPTDEAQHGCFGVGVSISGDGATVAASSSGLNGSIGCTLTDTPSPDHESVSVFNVVGFTWAQIANFKSTKPNSNLSFGESTALNYDGSTLVVGSSVEDLPSIYVLRRGPTEWQREAIISTLNPGANDPYGLVRVSVDALGSVIVAGTRSEDLTIGAGGGSPGSILQDAGGAYVFVRKNGGWSKSTFLTPTRPDALDGFGGAVALSRDGAFVAVGAPHEDSSAAEPAPNESRANSGAVFLFR